MFRKMVMTLTGAAIVVASAGLNADDTDLYLREGDPPPDSEPLVMFSIDYRPNLGSVVCRRGTGYNPLPGLQDGETECDFLVDQGYMPDKPAGDDYEFFDLIRGAFGYVLDEIGGVKLGLMFNHDHRNNCEGPDGARRAQCSNGGYIGMGFTLIETINELAADGTYVGGRKSCGPFQGTALESNTDRNYGGCASLGRIKAHNILWDIPVSSGDRTHSYQGKELFFEFFRYLRGFDVYNGHTGFTSYDGNDGYGEDLDEDGIPDDLLDPLPPDAPNPFNRADPANHDANNWNLDIDPLHVEYTPVPDGLGGTTWDRRAKYPWDASIEQDNGANWYEYKDPFGAGKCTSVYTVNMMFQVSNQEDDSDPEIQKAVADQGMGIGKRNPRFVDVIAKLREEDQSQAVSGDQGVTSYFLLADPFVKNRTGGSYALAGGTGAPLLLSDKPDELIANLTDIFKQILSVSTTFVAASIPVNSFNRAEVRDNVYLALFQPHPDKKPYWYGNVKKLKISGLNTADNVFLEDADGDPAIAADGRIRFDALTFWTTPTIYDVKDDYDINLGEVSLKDGRSVNRGGSGHKQRGFSAGSPGALNTDLGARQIFFDTTSSQLASLDATDPVASSVQADFGGIDTDETKLMIRWLRGQDVFDEDIDDVFAEGRRWYMASALHSRPIPVNYGARGSFTRTNPEIYVAVGTNDGLMRFIRNTPSSHTGGPQTASTYGEEVWAFAPRATMRTTEKLTREFRSLPSVGSQPPYGVDGAPVVYIEEDGDGTIEGGEKVWLFFGLRRGGRNYYGMDVSNPESPRLLWRIDGGVGDFAELGYTFSTPTVGRVSIGGSPTPVLIFAGGYDFVYDGTTRPTGTTPSAMGKAVFVVNAETGDLIRKFSSADMLDAIPSPATAVDLNGDGLFDRIVVGDMGGNVWRMDMPAGSDPASWTLNQLASFGVRAGADGDGQDRRFFHAPDVVPFRDSTGDYDAVIIGSGNRAKPLGSTVDNMMFVIKDRAVSTIDPPASGELTPVETGDLADITNCTDASTCASPPENLADGWKLELEATGEKSLATPITLSGIIFFTTFIPPGTLEDADECVPAEGQGRLYAVGLAEGNALVNRDKPIDEQDDPGTPEDRWENLASAGIPAEVVALPPKFILRPDLTVQDYPGRQRWRTFWYKEEDPGQ